MWSSTFLDESGHIAVPPALPRKERFQVPGNDSIQWIVFGIPRPVGMLDCHDGFRRMQAVRIRPHNGDSDLHSGGRPKIRFIRDNFIAFVSTLAIFGEESGRANLLFAAMGRRAIQPFEQSAYKNAS